MRYVCIDRCRDQYPIRMMCRVATSDYALLNIIFDIGGSIEFTRDGTPSTHDQGIDITLFFEPALTPTGYALLDLGRSKFDIGGNCFIFGHFEDGSISAVPLPAAAWLFGSALLGLGVVKRKRA